MRRHLPSLLAVVALVAALVGLRVDQPAAQATSTGAPSRPAAPLLSARRVPGLLAQPVGERRLVEALATLAERAPSSSCLIVGEGGRVLYERAPDAPLIPASTQKLLTAAAALHHLGPDARYRTTVMAARPPTSGMVDGDLWLVGAGDPLLGTADHAARARRQPVARTSLEELADSVVAAGVRVVRGRVVGDESRYDTRRVVASWKPGYVTGHQAGPLSALTVNDGFEVREGSVEPFAEPALGAAAALTGLLRARGVVVAGEPGAGVAPAAAVEVGAVVSPAMSDVVGHMLRESDNGTAELLLKEVGRVAAGEGSTAAGAAVVAGTLAEQGLPTEGVVVVDGSGLDRGNRVTCRLLHELLARAPADGPLVGGLAVAGSTGTLAGRMRGGVAEGRVRAKTGSLLGVRSLAGVVESDGGFQLHFAQVLNDLAPADEAAPQQDDLGGLLADYPNLPDLDLIAPAGYQWALDQPAPVLAQ